MKLTCNSQKNKNVELTKDDEGGLLLNGTALNDVENVYFYPCALNRGDAFIVILTKEETYFLKRNWLEAPLTRSDDDKEVVGELNEEMSQFSKNPCLDHVKSFEGQIENTWEMTNLFIVKEGILSPEAKFFQRFNQIECIFLERLSSYTRSFDLTFVVKDVKMTISAINRKASLEHIETTISAQPIKVYKTGPDPIPWEQVFSRRQTDKISWDDVYAMVTETSDDECDTESEWAPGETDTECLDLLSSDSEGSEYSEESDSDSEVDFVDNTDYDAWEEKEKVEDNNKRSRDCTTDSIDVGSDEDIDEDGEAIICKSKKRRILDSDNDEDYPKNLRRDVTSI